MDYVIKLRHYIKKESRKPKKGVHNVHLITRLVGTVLYTDKVAVLTELNRNYRYYEYRTAVKVS